MTHLASVGLGLRRRLCFCGLLLGTHLLNLLTLHLCEKTATS